MDLDATENVLPAAPENLCFNKDEFIKEDYDIDKFLANVRRHSSLETLREDLSVYMKILQNALVELINRDYADFVNLSSNLVGMDKIICTIKEPLTTFQGQVEELRSLITEKIEATQQKLAERVAVREKKCKACLTMEQFMVLYLPSIRIPALVTDDVPSRYEYSKAIFKFLNKYSMLYNKHIS
ncbi:COG2 [Bugula neritina]|uniref:Conserved oligomeric Golgi complex subunit 2 n=1 Tax=Bugula neritina TaxID=10212 RepID=A0A7J7JPY5_BUGNE|nr:COG2 [Bugula neritina]